MPGPATDVKNGGMATHLVTNLADLGSVGVPAPARTPLGGLGMGVELKMGSKPGLPEPKWRGRLERNRGSGILFSDPADPPDPPDPPEVVSGAAVQTLPNHAQESQDDVSSQANSLKLV